MGISFSCVIISENLFKPFLFAKIFFCLCSSVKNLFIFMLICENLFYYFKDSSFEMHFLRKQFWSALIFWNAFFEGAIILIFWFTAADKCGYCSMLSWLLISVTAALCFLLKVFTTCKTFSVLTCLNTNLGL